MHQTSQKIMCSPKSICNLNNALFERIDIDLLKLPLTKSGYNYAMVITEFLTNYP
jgi:hypothetical protein